MANLNASSQKKIYIYHKCQLFRSLRTGSQVEQGERESIAWRKKVGKPVDFVLMPPTHDTRFWYHDLIGQSSGCSQVSNEY